uniref:Site-specific integrase n=1 Tax=Oscillatoriales cyanobacterium SpSt-402 TaxID=2282168 RepID=A0A832M0W9_9CYAN
MLFYLWKRQTTYYYRIKVPSDLSSLFPCQLIRISLRTNDIGAAKVAAANIHRRVQNNFALLRSGTIDPESEGKLISSLLPNRKQFMVVEVESVAKSGSDLSEMIEAYIADRSPSWAEKTKLEFTCQYKVILNILGNKAVNDFTRADLVACREVLSRLPPNFSKKRDTCNITPIELSRTAWPETLKTKSVNSYINLVTSIFNWMHKNGIISNNIATGLVLPIASAPHEERKAYALEDIKRIKLHLPRDNDHPEKYWIPLIAMYQGMRLDEACQLHLEDILDVEGLPCFDINDAGDRNVKTRSSKRIVPIHPNLVELGLLDYVRQRQELEALQLWENIKPDKLGDWGKWFGNWYGRFNRKHVTADPLKVFHSFRHTVADTLKQAGVAEGIIAEILGHANQSITTGRYGKRYRPQVLMEALVKLAY